MVEALGVVRRKVRSEAGTSDGKRGNKGSSSKEVFDTLQGASDCDYYSDNAAKKVELEPVFKTPIASRH